VERYPQALTAAELIGAKRIFPTDNRYRKPAMRSVILWAIGIPIPLILLLAYCSGHL